MTDGIRFIAQPPWYFGSQNKTKPADGSYVTAAARYGFRGSREIQQFHTRPTSPATVTRNIHTPKFLKVEDVPDEWAPPIQASPLNRGHALTSPKLWPENTEFVTGYPHKKNPHSVFYQRETTTGLEERPSTSPGVMNLMKKTTAEFSVLTSSANLESRHLLASRPQTAISNFDSTWRERVESNANPVLRATMSRTITPYEPHTLMDRNDQMKYSGTTAMIVHASSAEEIKYKLQYDSLQTSIPFTLRWKQVLIMFRALKSRLKREQTMQQAILDLGDSLRNEAFKVGQKAVLIRSQFLHAMSKSSYFEHLPTKQISLLFSVFDPLKKTVVRYVDMLCTFSVLDLPTIMPNPIDIIVHLWRLFEMYGDDQQPIHVAESVLTTCCASEAEHKKMMRLVVSTMKPVLYRLAVQTDASSHISKPMSAPTPVVASPKDLLANHKQVKEAASENQRNQLKASVTRNKKKHLIVQPVYNIYDSVFDEDMLVKLLNECPDVVSLFNQYLSERLEHAYGKDPRASTDEMSEQSLEDKDFSWILSKSSKN